jgi:hypothetical protein
LHFPSAKSLGSTEFVMKLRFYARGTAHVSDFDALERPVPLRRFIGRKLQEAPGAPGRFAFVATGKPDEVSARPEVIKAARDGELWPADEATAQACGVAFDPKFGEVVAASEEKS